MRFCRLRPFVYFLCAVSLFVSWFTLSCAAAQTDTRTYVKRGSGGVLDAWIPPRFVDNPNCYLYYDDTGIKMSVTDLTAESDAPLAVKFDCPGSGSIYTKSGIFTYTFGFYPVTSDLSRSDILDSYDKTGTLSVTFNCEFFGSDSNFHPSLTEVVVPFKSKFIFKSSLGDMYRYTLFASNDASAASSVVSSVFDNGTFDMKFDSRFTLKYGFSATCYFSPLLISTNPAGAGMIEGGDSQIIVDGLENLEDAMNTAISSGVDKVSQVIVQETTKVTDKLDEVTQTIIDVGSDIDMSIDNSGLTSIQDRSKKISDQIYDKIDSGQVETVVTRRLSDSVADSYNHAGFELVGGWMQRIFDMGFGTIIFMCLTLGVSLFIIGRRM